jgi:hypothetical protein
MMLLLHQGLQMYFPLKMVVLLTSWLAPNCLQANFCYVAGERDNYQCIPEDDGLFAASKVMGGRAVACFTAAHESCVP